MILMKVMLHYHNLTHQHIAKFVVCNISKFEFAVFEPALLTLIKNLKQC